MTDQPTCKTCGKTNFPAWNAEGECITCARDAVLGKQPEAKTEPMYNACCRQAFPHDCDTHGDTMWLRKEMGYEYHHLEALPNHQTSEGNTHPSPSSPTSEREKIEKLYAYSKEAEWDQWQAAAELLLREAREQGYDKGWSIKGNTSNTDYDEVRREGLAELENSNG